MNVELPHGQLSTSEHRPSTLPVHAHEAASFCLVIDGTFREASRRRTETFGREDVIFRLPGERHSNTFDADLVRCFNVLFDPGLLPDGPPSLGAASPLLRRLLSRSRRGASALTLEGLLLQLIGDTFDAPPVRGSLVAETDRIITDRFTESLTIRTIAVELSTHPVHLARTYKRERGRAISDAIRTLRVEHAKHLLQTGTSSLAEIALASGFADQSHFTKVFRRITGVTPGAWR